MPIKKVFIIVPSNVDASPIKGAAALANALSKWVTVCFVTLKKSTKSFSLLNSDVEWVSLGEYSSWLKKVEVLRSMLKEAVDEKSVATVSSSLSADFVNIFCADLAVTCSSVRGNLPVNYENTYGLIGKFIAYFHLKLLKRVGVVVSMTDSMANQVK